MWNRESQKSPNMAVQTPPAAPATEPAPPQPVAAAAPPVPAVPGKAKGSTLVIKGELISSEDLVFEGSLEGKVSLPDHMLTIGLGAQVSAEIVARVIVVHGSVTGNVFASERVEIRSSGRMHGDLVSPRVLMNDGATFKGRLETRLPEKHDAKPKQPELVAV
jgi:cytoskeletal protein CcmA (bactofilin family)